MIAGSTRCSQPPRPDVGSQPRWTANTTIAIKPSQKWGIDCPRVASAVSAPSIHESRRMAAITPSGIAIAIARSWATRASWTVATARSLTISSAGRR